MALMLLAVIYVEALTIDGHYYAHRQKTQRSTARTFFIAKQHTHLFKNIYFFHQKIDIVKIEMLS